ncbi:MAG: hypothetical protein HXL32_08965 [Prevotellaceae bacterium]|nr:hypothetical protein [Prevotellaceae bacterium]
MPIRHSKRVMTHFAAQWQPLPNSMQPQHRGKAKRTGEKTNDNNSLNTLY